MTDTPCGPGADARYCETFWAQNAEIERLQGELTAARSARTAAEADSGRLRAEVEELQRAIRSPSAWLAGLACGMRKVTGADGDDWKQWADCVMKAAEELCALLPENQDEAPAAVSGAERARDEGDGKLREALAVAAAERNQRRIQLDRIRATVQGCAVGAMATGNGDRERAFLDVLILLERAGLEPAGAAPAPDRAALLTLVAAHFVGNGPYPLQLVCSTEDASDAECDQTIAEVEPGVAWDELEARIAAHAAEYHTAATPADAKPQVSVKLPAAASGTEGAGG